MAIVYTDLAQPLLDYVSSVEGLTSGNSNSLNINLTLSADYFLSTPQIMTANFGFDGYMGVPGLNGTGSDAQAAANQYNVSWESIDPALNAPVRATYSAVGTAAFLAIYGVPALLADTIPVVFTHPVLGDTLNPTDFRVALNTGEVVTPITASFLPNLEFNERQTAVISGDWGNRILPGEPGSRYPVSVTIFKDETPLRLVTQTGLVSAVGLTVQSKNPYVEGNGPRILSAKLNAFSDLGEGNPAWQANSTANSGSDLYGDQAMYRLRIYTSAGFSPDGIASITPDDFAKFFQITALDVNGNTVTILETGVDYRIPGYGTVRVLGVADTGLAQDAYDLAYVEDHDNQYDIILGGDAAAIARLQAVRMPSGDGYSPVYNPGGPGNDPDNNPPGPFTVGSADQTVAITQDIEVSSFVTYVEIDGPVVRNAITAQPIGSNRGLAVDDTSTGHQVFQYMDPDGKIFYASFAVSPVYDIVLTESSPSTNSRVTDDHITGSVGLNTVTFSGEFDQYDRDGGLDRFFSRDLVALRDADDTLIEVERVVYTDTALALDILGDAGAAYRFYGVFDRQPDEQGLGYWIHALDQGASLRTVAEGFLDSAEFMVDYGILLSNARYLEQLYQHFFNRAPDDSGFAYWLSVLDRGVNDRADVLVNFAQSSEYRSLVSTEIANGILYDVWPG